MVAEIEPEVPSDKAEPETCAKRVYERQTPKPEVKCSVEEDEKGANTRSKF